jgi:hypothetical protein
MGVLIAELRYFLPRDLSLVKLPPPVMRLRGYLGAIVEAVTSRSRKEINYVTQVKCHRRPRHHRCEGNIIAYFDEDEPSTIKWGCPFCGDSGYIRGWQGTVWDKTQRT